MAPRSFASSTTSRAREELQAYLNGPDDARYQKAADAAEEIRRKQRELDQQFRKNYREVSDLWSYPGLRRRPVTVLELTTSSRKDPP